jgi:hypothetical protein
VPENTPTLVADRRPDNADRTAKALADLRDGMSRTAVKLAHGMGWDRVCALAEQVAAEAPAEEPGPWDISLQLTPSQADAILATCTTEELLAALPQQSLAARMDLVVAVIQRRLTHVANPATGHPERNNHA